MRKECSLGQCNGLLHVCLCDGDAMAPATPPKTRFTAFSHSTVSSILLFNYIS